MQKTLMDCDNLFIYPDIKSRDELFLLIHDALYKKGMVKEGFYIALKERENLYPTGLDIGEYGIAIPHTDPDVIERQGIAVAILKKPLSFREMGTPDRNIKVRIVFLLMLKENKAGFYHNLLNKIKNSDILHKIYNEDDRHILCLLLTELLNT